MEFDLGPEGDNMDRIVGGLVPPAGEAPPDPSAPPAVVWTELDPDEAAAAWRSLATWVHWLIERYGLGSKIPPCWPSHGWLVEELAAQQASWKTTYGGPGFGDAPAAWHRGLAEFLGRADTVWADQRCGTHDHEPGVASWTHSQQGQSDVAARIKADLELRVNDAADVLDSTAAGRTQQHSSLGLLDN